MVDVEFITLEDAEYLLNDIELVYPEGVVTDKESVDNKDFLKKMSLLTFLEMRESGKRFGVNDVTKRRLSFTDSRNGKKFKKNIKSKDESGIEEENDKSDNAKNEKSETETTEESQANADPVTESKPETKSEEHAEVSSESAVTA